MPKLRLSISLLSLQVNIFSCMASIQKALMLGGSRFLMRVTKVRTSASVLPFKYITCPQSNWNNNHLFIIRLCSERLPGDTGLSGTPVQSLVPVLSKRSSGVGGPHGLSNTAKGWTPEGQHSRHDRSALAIDFCLLDSSHMNQFMEKKL